MSHIVFVSQVQWEQKLEAFAPLCQHVSFLIHSLTLSLPPGCFYIYIPYFTFCTHVLHEFELDPLFLCFF